MIPGEPQSAEVPLKFRLHCPTLAVSSDGDRIGSEDLSRRAEALIAALRGYQGCRVALASRRPEDILVSLAAAESAGCELLLHRTESNPAALSDTWNFSAVINSSLTVTPFGRCEPHGEGFAILLATSGTTGEPKLARHTLKSLLGRIREVSSGVPARWLLAYHPATFGGLQVLLTVLVTGAELIAVPHTGIPELADAAAAHAPTHISGTPTFWRSFLACLGSRVHQLPLRQITLGGEIADQPILDRLRTTFPEARISHIYASTEAGALFSVRDGRAGFPAGWLTTGVEGVQLRIREAVLEVRSPRAMSHYINRETGPLFSDDGWLITGDLVELAGDRVLFHGRQDFLLNIGGAKVRPEEVEAALLGLAEVADASVYGVKNPLTGFLVGADIVLRADLPAGDARTSILTALRAQLESYKVPRILKFVDAIAVSEAGKKDKRR
jgi:acyl-CoA synthetase (AMP-forming)/AMP-acid ligase II